MILLMAAGKKGVGRGKHGNPRSLQNLIHEGRPRLYPEPKERHNVSVTQPGWEGFEELADQIGMKPSQLIEALGRNELNLSLSLAEILDESRVEKLGMSREDLLEKPLVEVLKLLANLD